MIIPRRNAVEDSKPPNRPALLPQRWLVIFGLSGIVAAALSYAVNPPTGATIGIAVVVMLHTITE